MAEIKVRVGQQNAIKVTSSLAGSGAGTLGELSDVSIQNPQNGMILYTTVPLKSGLEHLNAHQVQHRIWI